MTAVSKEKEMPHNFFVYGTLRDDDDSEAPWTKNFIENGIPFFVLFLQKKKGNIKQA